MNNQKEKLILIIAIMTLLAGAAVFIFLNSSALPRTSKTKSNRPEVQPTNTTLFFAGDIMLSREVRGKILQANDVNLPYLNNVDIIKSADIAFANLESPFNDKGAQSTNRLIFKAEPNTVTGLVNAGFDVLSTANNHAYDQGPEAVTYTNDWLKGNSITPVGTGLDCHDGILKEVNGIKFGFLAYSYAAFNDGGAVSDKLVCDWKNQIEFFEDINTLKKKVDFLIVSGHFGEEYKRKPSSEDAANARAMIDVGADMIIGHHPHWVQTIEEYKGKYIFYSLGNFVFDQMWSQDTQEGLTTQITFKDKVLDRIELKPVLIEDYCCPRWANELEAKNILTKINPEYASPVLVDGGITTPNWATATSQNFQLRTP